MIVLWRGKPPLILDPGRKHAKSDSTKIFILLLLLQYKLCWLHCILLHVSFLTLSSDSKIIRTLYLQPIPHLVNVFVRLFRESSKYRRSWELLLSLEYFYLSLLSVTLWTDFAIFQTQINIGLCNFPRLCERGNLLFKLLNIVAFTW